MQLQQRRSSQFRSPRTTKRRTLPSSATTAMISPSKSMNAQGDCPFFKPRFAPELRNEIYALVFKSETSEDGSIELNGTTTPPSKSSPWPARNFIMRLAPCIEQRTAASQTTLSPSTSESALSRLRSHLPSATTSSPASTRSACRGATSTRRSGPCISPLTSNETPPIKNSGHGSRTAATTTTTTTTPIPSA